MFLAEEQWGNHEMCFRKKALTKGAGGELVIRIADDKEIPSLIGVFRESILGSCEKEYTVRQREAWVSRGSYRRFKELLAKFQFFLAETGEQAVGFTSISEQGYLHSLFVLPESQRKGVATALTEEAIRFALKAGAETLSAEVSKTALPFFMRLEFSSTAGTTGSVG